MNRSVDEFIQDEQWSEGNDDDREERGSMPVGRHARARAASKTSWKTRRTSNQHSKNHGGMHHRRRRRILD